MNNRSLKTAIVIVVFMSIVIQIGCEQRPVFIERFEFLDEYSPSNNKDPNRNNRLLYEAYLVHNYKKRNDENIQQQVDRFICDSIIPTLDFYHRKEFIFYRKTGNTNRKSFQKGGNKNKIIRANSKDILYSYNFEKNKDSIIFAVQKFIYEFKPMPDSPPQKFKCN